MKTNELMIGDYITVTPSGMLIQVAAVHKKKVAYHTCTNKLSWVREGLLRPIPLTPEILKKNGFTQCEPQGYDLYIKDKEGAGLYRIFWQGESYNYYLEIAAYAYPSGEFNNTNIKYVHQLQHALRLCGIEKEIEL